MRSSRQIERRGSEDIAFRVLAASQAPDQRQVAEADQRDDGEHGDGCGYELPAALASKAGRLARLRQAKAQLEAETAARQQRRQQRYQ